MHDDDETKDDETDGTKYIEWPILFYKNKRNNIIYGYLNLMMCT